ncbi:glycosyltransferase [Rhizobium straminoryzae]|uniref:Glycosyltransferase n=1 Tax=Rhizobium straminoryzae TaxID=1387186 RepID=A0A549T7D8_9HYPH|nr:glycosyltransferase [Rhizobium straminoryzae]TRL37784.1 glycosyltransferase [Rhizobium straminoryzae]
MANAAAGRLAFLVRGLDGGGAQKDAILMANALSALGIATAIVTLEARGPLRTLLRADVPLIDLGAGEKLRLAAAGPALRRLLSQTPPRALVASEAGANALVSLVASTLPRHKRPFILLREVATPSVAVTGDPYWQNRLGYRLAPFTYPRADLVTTFTEGARQDLITRFRVPAARVVNLGTNTVVTPEMRRQIEATPRRVRPGAIVSVGRLSPEKGFATLIAAFARLRTTHAEATLTILGEGAERPALEAGIARLGIGDRARLAGHDPNPVARLREAALFVCASSHEGFGNAIIEALACGVPVVATDAPYGPRDILDGGRFGPLVPVGDAEALATAMAATLRSPPDSAVLMRRAADFSVEAAAERFCAVLVEAGLDVNGASISTRETPSGTPETVVRPR